MKILLSHPTGNANVRATASAFKKSGLLSEFVTTVATFQDSFLDRLSTIGPFSEFRRRSFDVSLRHVTKSYPWRELGRLSASKSGLKSLIKHEFGFFSIDAVYRNFDQKVANRLLVAKREGIEAVYSYEDGAALTFKKAKNLNLQCFYDLPTGHWRAARQLLHEEIDKNPEWAATFTGLKDSEKKLARKDDELQSANRIFVASQFTANTLNTFPHQLPPVEVISYGFPSVNLERNYSAIKKGRPLKILFVGKLTQQKGISYLFDAVNFFGRHISLTIVGHKATDDCAALNQAIQQHRYIPSLPHAEILEMMKQHDVLAFPTLFDGFGLVVSEAMSQGTPVIATERCAGPDLINHGENGWLVKAGCSESLKQVIEELIYRPDLVKEAGIKAMKTAQERPWAKYESEMVRAVSKNLFISDFSA